MKLTTQIASVILVCFTLSCDSMREVSIYEPSKSISAFESFLIKHFSQILKKMEFGD